MSAAAVGFVADAGITNRADVDDDEVVENFAAAPVAEIVMSDMDNDYNLDASGVRKFTV